MAKPDFLLRARNLLPYLSNKEQARVAEAMAAMCEAERDACEERAIKAIRANPTRYETATLRLEAEADVCVAIRNSGDVTRCVCSAAVRTDPAHPDNCTLQRRAARPV